MPDHEVADLEDVELGADAVPPSRPTVWSIFRKHGWRHAVQYILERMCVSATAAAHTDGKKHGYSLV